MRKNADITKVQKNAPEKSAFSNFSLIELLIVIFIITLLAGILLPVLRTAKAKAEATSCANNLKQLFTANEAYHTDNERVVASAPDTMSNNLHRWHGIRTTADNTEDFDPQKGPLYNYLGSTDDVKVKICPTLAGMIDKSLPAYEKGGGGYGYNDGVGSRIYFESATYDNPTWVEGIKMEKILVPAGTVMFADSACLVKDNGDSPAGYQEGCKLAENSFAQARYFVNAAEEAPVWGDPNPTIHFRHAGQANVIWCDGHISNENMNISIAGFKDFKLGWFGDDSNKFFDPRK